MLRISFLVVVAAYAAACTSQPTTNVTGTLALQSNGQPPLGEPTIFDDTLDSIDRVHVEVIDLDAGKTVQTADFPGASVEFEFDGLPSSDYSLTATADHQQAVTGDWEQMGATESQFTASGEPVDLGTMPLLYQPEY
jgi:hypothetical protein